MRYNSEIDVREALGIESWRNLSKGAFLRFLAALPEIDKDVALQLIAQIPAITTFARGALDDAAKAYGDHLASNARSMEMVHQVHLEQLAILRAELDKDVTAEDRMRVYADIRGVCMSALTKDTENKQFLAEHLDKLLTLGLASVLAVAGGLVVATKSGNKPVFSLGRLLAA